MRAGLLAAGVALAMAACGGGSGPGGIAGPPSAKSVATSDSDFSGLRRCSESGSFDSYLSTEKSKNPDQYQTDKTSWDRLKSAGANDAYIAVYAKNTTDCGLFGIGQPAGEIVNVFVVRFKDTATAQSNYKADAKTFHVTDSELQSFQSAGGSVIQGSGTGLGNNSVAVSVSFGGSSFFIAFWQNKSFEVAVDAFNLPSTEGGTATKKINGRIR